MFDENDSPVRCENISVLHGAFPCFFSNVRPPSHSSPDIFTSKWIKGLFQLSQSWQWLLEQWKMNQEDFRFYFLWMKCVLQW